ncbi:MAG: ATP-binding protein, partial [Bacteroidota bacterium]
NGTFLTKIYQEDGLIEDEGNRFSSLKTRDGKLLFGFISGITEIDPERTKAQLLSGEKLKIFLTQLSYFDKSLKKDTFQTLGLNAALSLNLPATHRYLKLRLALSDFQRIEENTFSYRLEGLKKGEEPEWTFIGNQPELNLTNLPPGEYDLVIRGTNYRAQKTVTPVRIKLRVQEFFYKKTWFYILVFLLLSALPILWLIRERFERQRLQRLVKERTKEIETDKKVIEAQAERLQALDQSKSRFFTNISHEFRTPLTVISGMVAQFKGNDRAKQLVQRNTDQLLQLINQILDLRKLESSRLPTHYIQADVVSYLRYITESFHSLSTNKAVKISFHTTEESMLLDYDPDKLLRIVSNLLSNAIKFTPAGGSVTVAVEVQKDSMPLQYRFSVRDTGVGIPVNKLPHIFDRFYQVDDSITRSGEGTGIGLTLTKELVELMNGKIQVESQEAKGSTFTVILPLTQEAALEENRQLAKAAIPVMPDFPTSDLLQAERIGDEDLPRLLLVEDNPDVMAYLVACLEGEYQLSLAFDGQEGIDKALEEIPDIIISDVMMPKRDGFDLCNSLKTEKRTSHIPIILLTAKADADSRITGLERGANAYLAKPFVQRELKAQVRNLFALRQSLQARYADLESLEPSKEPEVEQEDIFVLNVKALVLKNLDDLDYDLNALSKALNLSRSQLGRKLKALTGNSPGIFIRNIRLHEAKRLLLTTDRSVKEIAYDVGFSSHNYFTNSYTAAFNESPSDTRQSGKTRT